MDTRGKKSTKYMVESWRSEASAKPGTMYAIGMGKSLALGKSVGACVRRPPSVSRPGGSFAFASSFPPYAHKTGPLNIQRRS